MAAIAAGQAVDPVADDLAAADPGLGASKSPTSKRKKLRGPKSSKSTSLCFQVCALPMVFGSV